MKPKDTTPMDIAIGSRVHQARIIAGLSQEQLSERVGISRQQIQKYERGEDRITAGRLKAVSKALYTPISFFFDDADAIIEQPMVQALALKVTSLYSRIKTPEVQMAILQFMEAINIKAI